MPPTPSGEGGAGGDGKVIPVPTADFKKIKDEAREKGRREALSEFDAMAAEHGFSDLKGALAALADLKKKPAAEPTTTTPKPTETTMANTAPKKKPDDDRAKDKAAREADRLANERTKLRKDWRQSEKKNRDLKKQLDAKEAEKDLYVEMVRAGVKDPDYVQRLVMRELQGKSVEEVKAFDRTAFYTKLKTTQPYLFGETVVPVTTGTNGTKPDGSAPAAPAPATTVPAAAAAGQFDARKASKEEYEAHLRKLGLNPNL